MLLAFIIALSANAVLLGALLIRQQTINEQIKLMAKTAEELAAEIRAANAQTRKATDEVLAKIKRLEDAVNGGNLAVIEEAVNELKVSTQALDDVVPDAPAPEQAPA